MGWKYTLKAEWKKFVFVIIYIKAGDLDVLHSWTYCPVSVSTWHILELIVMQVYGVLVILFSCALF